MIRLEKNERLGEKIQKRFRVSILRADLIDRCVIFTVNPTGFHLYVCIKGNLSEYEQRRIVGKISFLFVEKDFSHFVRWFSGESSQRLERVSLESDDCPTFSTIALNFYTKKSPKAEGVFEIKRLFKSFLDFFYFNQIHVCFGSIETIRGPIICTLPSNISSRNSIQIYAVIMLRHVGYSVIQKLHEDETFYDLLIEMAGQDNDKWYRLCLYVVRRASEYRFLHVSSTMTRSIEKFSSIVSFSFIVN